MIAGRTGKYQGRVVESEVQRRVLDCCVFVLGVGGVVGVVWRGTIRTSSANNLAPTCRREQRYRGRRLEVARKRIASLAGCFGRREGRGGGCSETRQFFHTTDSSDAGSSLAHMRSSRSRVAEPAHRHSGPSPPLIWPICWLWSYALSRLLIYASCLPHVLRRCSASEPAVSRVPSPKAVLHEAATPPRWLDVPAPESRPFNSRDQNDLHTSGVMKLSLLYPYRTPSCCHTVSSNLTVVNRLEAYQFLPPRSMQIDSIESG
jgi:hypothetical protein